MPRFTFADGRPNVAAPPRRAAVVRAGPPSAFQQLRELSERHRREACSPPEGPDVATIDNGGALEPAVAAFLAALGAGV